MSDNGYQDYRTASWPTVECLARRYGFLVCRVPVYMFLYDQCPETFGGMRMEDVDTGAMAHMSDLCWRYRIHPEAIWQHLSRIAKQQRTILPATILGSPWAAKEAERAADAQSRSGTDHLGYSLGPVKRGIRVEVEELGKEIDRTREREGLSLPEAAERILADPRAGLSDTLFRCAVRYGAHEAATSHLPGAIWIEHVRPLRERAWHTTLRQLCGT